MAARTQARERETLTTQIEGPRRLFVALPIPDAVRDPLEAAVGSVRENHPQVRWTRPDGWHVTLAFLGKVPEHQVSEASETLRTTVPLARAPERLRLSHAGRFGKRVLWLAVEDEPADTLADLGEAIQARLEADGLPVTRREVAPHLTLARAGKAGVTLELVETLAARFPTAAATGWRPAAVELWSSALGRGPARYEAVASIPIPG